MARSLDPVIVVRRAHGMALISKTAGTLGRLHARHRTERRSRNHVHFPTMRNDIAADHAALQQLRQSARALTLPVASDYASDAELIAAVLRAIEDGRLTVVFLPKPPMPFYWTAGLGRARRTPTADWSNCLLVAAGSHDCNAPTCSGASGGGPEGRLQRDGFETGIDYTRDYTGRC